MKKLTPWNIQDHLKTNEQRTEYLRAVLEENDYFWFPFLFRSKIDHCLYSSNVKDPFWWLHFAQQGYKLLVPNSACRERGGSWSIVRSFDLVIGL